MSTKILLRLLEKLDIELSYLFLIRITIIRNCANPNSLCFWLQTVVAVWSICVDLHTVIKLRGNSNLIIIWRQSFSHRVSSNFNQLIIACTSHNNVIHLLKPLKLIKIKQTPTIPWYHTMFSKLLQFSKDWLYHMKGYVRVYIEDSIHFLLHLSLNVIRYGSSPQHTSHAFVSHTNW